MEKKTLEISVGKFKLFDALIYNGSDGRKKKKGVE